MKNLEFVVAEANIVEFSEGVLDTLDQLKFTFDYDETSPPDEKGNVTYKVIGVRKKERT